MTKKILIIFAHPKKKSLNHFLLEHYTKELKKAKIKNKTINLYKNPSPYLTLSKKDSKNPNIKKHQNLIKWADHITFIYPIWWYNFPAILKNFFDTTLTPNFAYKYQPSNFLMKTLGMPATPTGLLKGKTATIIRTYGGPKIGKTIFDTNTKNITKAILGFCGIKTTQKLSLYATNTPSFNKNKLQKFTTKISKSIIKLK